MGNNELVEAASAISPGASSRNDVRHAGTGNFDPDEFWHARRGAEVTVVIFDPKWNVWDGIEMEFEELRHD